MALDHIVGSSTLDHIDATMTLDTILAFDTIGCLADVLWAHHEKLSKPVQV
jgi:hypothetical protein